MRYKMNLEMAEEKRVASWCVKKELDGGSNESSAEKCQEKSKWTKQIFKKRRRGEGETIRLNVNEREEEVSMLPASGSDNGKDNIDDKRIQQRIKEEGRRRGVKGGSDYRGNEGRLEAK